MGILDFLPFLASHEAKAWKGHRDYREHLKAKYKVDNFAGANHHLLTNDEYNKLFELTRRL